MKAPYLTINNDYHFDIKTFAGCDYLSHPFCFKLVTLSSTQQLHINTLIAKPAYINLNGLLWHGLIYSARKQSLSNKRYVYQFYLCPWLRFLNGVKKSAVHARHTDMSAPQIIQTLFKKHGYYDYDSSGLTRHYPRLKYYIQYQESDFNFISRLMLQFGIYYYFQHKDNRHVLYLLDKQTRTQSPHSLHYDPNGYSLFSWKKTSLITPQSYINENYTIDNPCSPRRIKKQSSKQNNILQHYTLNHYQYDKPYEHYQQPDYHIGKSHIPLRANDQIIVEKAYHPELQGQFLIAANYHHSDYHDSDMTYQNTFFAYSKQHNFIPCTRYDEHQLPLHNHISPLEKETPQIMLRITTPHIPGAQLAQVVGPKGEKIYSKDYARIKIQFSWDKEGEFNEQSSQWIRARQPWCGHGYGYLFLPRIGQTVVTGFIAGDPNRAIVLACINNQHSTAFGPQNYGFKTQSFAHNENPASNSLSFNNRSKQVEAHAARDCIVEAHKNIDHHIQGASRYITNKGNITLSAKNEIIIKADQCIRFICGNSELSLGNTGISLKAKKIELN